MTLPGSTTHFTWTVMGVYLLLVLGATTASSPIDGVLPYIHYTAAVVVGVLLLALVTRIWTASGKVPGGHSGDSVRGASRRVRAVLTLAIIGYPLQAGVGILVAAGTIDAQGHLVGGMLVFAALLVGLVWHLEDQQSIASSSVRTRSEIRVDQSSPAAERALDGPTASNDDASRALGDTVRAYVALTKPRLMWLLCLLAVAGMALATVTGPALDGIVVVATLTGGVLAIGASGTFNHVYERDRDAKMDRTADRPVATAQIPAWRATTFGVLLAASSMAILLALVNVLAAILTALAIIYYSVVYTVVLKPTTRWNTVIGGGAGALPAVIGYVAIAGEIAAPAVLLAVVVFCWTPAHFYNLAIAHREDYARASYPMLPVVAGIDLTRRRIVYWLGATLIAAGWLGASANLGTLYAITVAGVGGIFAWSVVLQYVEGDGSRDGSTLESRAYRSFMASNLFLGSLLAVIVIEAVVM